MKGATFHVATAATVLPRLVLSVVVVVVLLLLTTTHAPTGSSLELEVERGHLLEASTSRLNDRNRTGSGVVRKRKCYQAYVLLLRL